MHIDINCDMGEGIGKEALLMPFISAANIACGYHAGDENEMKKMVALCLKHDVAIGAHPSFPDRENFGRTAMHFPPNEILEIVEKQLTILHKIVMEAGGKLHHVKPHGAMYNMAAKDEVLANAIVTAVKNFDSSLILYGLSGSIMTMEGLRLGLPIAQEVFADRTYLADGSLTPRTVAGALITNTTQVLQQILQMVQEQKVTAITGENVAIQADTICIHGDGINAVELAKTIHSNLLDAGIKIQKI